MFSEDACPDFIYDIATKTVTAKCSPYPRGQSLPLTLHRVRLISSSSLGVGVCNVSGARPRGQMYKAFYCVSYKITFYY